MRLVVALAFGALLPVHAAANPALVDSRVIVGFDRQPEVWLVKGRTRLLPTLGPTPVWSLTGRVRCLGDACPARSARIKGTVRAPGGTFHLTARFARRTICTFTGTPDDPSAPAAYTCTDREGNVTLQRPLHVGLCRCIVARAEPGPAFCALEPCPF